MKKAATTNIIYIINVLILLTMLTGCYNRNDKSNGTEYFIYYLNNEENQLVKESVYLMLTNVEEQLEVILSNLEKEPKNIMYKKAKKDFIHILDYTLIDKKLTLNFDTSYSQMTGINEILCRAAIVKTLCQIDGVDYVEFIVGDQPLKTSQERLVGLMSEEDFVDNMTGETIYRQNMNLSMYFANKGGNGLVVIPITRLFDGSIPLEQMVIQQLIQGPEAINGIDEGLVQSTIPKGTKLNQISVKDRVAYVDFSSEFLLGASDIKNEVILYAVVNVLVELPSIDKVQFLIDGNTMDKYGDIEIGVPLERNLDIVQQMKE